MEKKLISLLEILKILGFDEFYSSGDLKKTPTNLSKAEKENLEISAPEHPSIPSDHGKENKLKIKLLEELLENNKNCCRCDLCKSRTQIVFFDGNPSSRIMFVGEAPGEEEDKRGKPFVGRAGQLLNKVLEEIGLKREQIYITNVCKCRPPENRKPQPAEMQACINTFLKKELEIVDPKVICCLGATAAEAFLGKKVRITKMRGKFYPNPLYPKAKLFLTYHPAYILRNMKEYKTFKEDLKKLKQFLTEKLS